MIIDAALQLAFGRLLGVLLQKGVLTIDEVAQVQAMTPEQVATTLFDMAKVLGIDPVDATEAIMRLREREDGG